MKTARQRAGKVLRKGKKRMKQIRAAAHHSRNSDWSIQPDSERFRSVPIGVRASSDARGRRLPEKMNSHGAL
jgi:hypothetical protein